MHAGLEKKRDSEGKKAGGDNSQIHQKAINHQHQRLTQLRHGEMGRELLGGPNLLQKKAPSWTCRKRPSQEDTRWLICNLVYLLKSNANVGDVTREDWGDVEKSRARNHRKALGDTRNHTGR